MLSRDDFKISNLSNDELIFLINSIKNTHEDDGNYTPPEKICEFWKSTTNVFRNNHTIFDLLKLYQILVDELITRFQSINKDKLDPKYIGIPNINFGYDVDDDRKERFKKQRLERGFDDSEMWSLYGTISQFILPRLKDYRECIEEFGIHPGGLKNTAKWLELLDKMILAFDLLVTRDSSGMDNDEFDKKIDEGLKTFTKWFSALWY
jgi:hypothetical protein